MLIFAPRFGIQFDVFVNYTDKHPVDILNGLLAIRYSNATFTEITK